MWKNFLFSYTYSVFLLQYLMQLVFEMLLIDFRVSSELNYSPNKDFTVQPILSLDLNA